MDGWVGYVVVALLSVGVGWAELGSRYRDQPYALLRVWAGLSYLFVNVAASVLALYAIRAFGWDFGVKKGSALDLARVAIAGLGALALFRTKLFVVAQQGEAVSWGPSRLLDQMLAITDRQVDRSQAGLRSREAAKAMTAVSFTKAHALLPAYVLGVLENVGPEEQQRLADDIKALVDDQTIDDAGKAQVLGVAVMRITGPKLLQQAVKALGDSIRRT